MSDLRRRLLSRSQTPDLSSLKAPLSLSPFSLFLKFLLFRFIIFGRPRPVMGHPSKSSSTCSHSFHVAEERSGQTFWMKDQINVSFKTTHMHRSTRNSGCKWNNFYPLKNTERLNENEAFSTAYGVDCQFLGGGGIEIDCISRCLCCCNTSPETIYTHVLPLRANCSAVDP